MDSPPAALGTRATAALELLDRIAGLPVVDRTDPRVAEFADQFGLDVSAIDDGQRAAFFEATGSGAFAVTQQIYAADFVPRVRSVLDALFGEQDWRSTPYQGDSWPLLEEFMVAVARLDALDPVLTELVRLRGARQHRCAVCSSRRSQDAITAGADGELFAAVDAYADSSLPARTKAALALTDALIWTPYDVPARVLAEVHDALSTDEAVEVVLDVMRNAANKIAVALGADAATVTEGVELFSTDADGTLTVVGTVADPA